MPINNLSQFRWKSDFHKVCWEKIKELKPELPRWTWDELVKYGWGIRINPTNNRADIDLIHTDGTFISFRLSINGQIMPHVEAMVFRLFGIHSTTCTREESNLIYPQLQNFPGFVATRANTWISV